MPSLIESAGQAETVDKSAMDRWAAVTTVMSGSRADSRRGPWRVMVIGILPSRFGCVLVCFASCNGRLDSESKPFSLPPL